MCKGSIDPFVSNITDADADLVIIPFDLVISQVFGI